jgi:hypothetical protein
MQIGSSADGMKFCTSESYGLPLINSDICSTFYASEVKVKGKVAPVLN